MQRLSRLIVGAHSAGILLLALATITIALTARRVFLEYSINPISAYMEPFLAEVIPPNVVRVLFGAGVYMIVLACCGFYAVCAEPGVGQQWALSMLLLLTIPSLIIAVFGTALALSHDSVVDIASYQDVVDVDIDQATSSLKQNVLYGLKAAFVTGWADCNPAALSTASVKQACSITYPENECAYIPEGHLGLFCQLGPGPFDPDVTFDFQDPSAPLDVVRLGSSANSFASLINWACMPPIEIARAMQWAASMFNHSESVDQPLLSAFNSTFVDCYASSWWAPSGDTSGGEEPFPNYPNGTAFTQRDARFFNSITHADDNAGSLYGSFIDPKLAFCACADRGSDALKTLLPKADALTWMVPFATALISALVLMAECYLCTVHYEMPQRSRDLVRRVRRRVASAEKTPLRSRACKVRASGSTLSSMVELIASEFELSLNMPFEKIIAEAEVAAFGIIQRGALKERAISLLDFCSEC